MYPLHPPAGKHTSMAVNAGMLPATLGAQAAHVAAGVGMLQHVRRRMSVQVRMRLKGMASAWMCGAQGGRVSDMRLAQAGRPTFPEIF